MTAPVISSKAPKPKFPRDLAIMACRDILNILTPVADRIVVAGSLRRRQKFVGDIEILFIPTLYMVPDGLFDTVEVNKTDLHIEALITAGVLARRPNSAGREAWGKLNKLAVHVQTGIPVDLFAATRENWWNYLVCRTGSAENNINISMAARRKGWKWHPYGSGFTDRDGSMVHVESEREVYEYAGVPYLEPWQR